MIFQLSIIQREIVELQTGMKLRHAIVWNALIQLSTVKCTDSLGNDHYLLDRKEISGINYFQIDYQLLCDELPICDWKYETMRKIVKDLCKLKVLTPFPKNRGQGSAYFTWGSLTGTLITTTASNITKGKASKSEKQRSKNTVENEKQRSKNTVDQRSKNTVGDPLHLSSHISQINIPFLNSPLSNFYKVNLVELGVSESWADWIQARFTDEEFTKIMDRVEKYGSEGQVKNYAGYIVQCFKFEWEKKSDQ